MQALFIAYNDETDSARANYVRKKLLTTERFLVEGHAPFTTWANANKSPLSDLRAQFDAQLKPCVAALILIGEDCALNPWIRYAIEQCYKGAKPLLAIDISAIPDEYGKTCSPDINPLERFAVLEGGKKIYLSDRYQTYQWTDDVDHRLEDWLATAAKNAVATERAKETQQTTGGSRYRDYESMRIARQATQSGISR